MQLIKFFCLFSVIFFSHLAPAQVKIAFIKVYTPNCNLVYLEPPFEYSHVAISYQDGWLNAHPKHGVQFTKTLEELDFPKTQYKIMEHPLMSEIEYHEVQNIIGKPYDSSFNWKTNQSFYCTELVAKLIGVKPVPMYFDPKVWPPQYQKLNGQPGISPFLLLQKMLKIGFLPTF